MKTEVTIGGAAVAGENSPEAVLDPRMSAYALEDYTVVRHVMVRHG